MAKPDQNVGLKSLTDAQLSQRIREGEEPSFDELALRYSSLIRKKACAFRKMGLEPDDLFQEGTLGLLNAALAYRETGEASFATYAGLCIERRMLGAYRSAARQKHIPLNSFISLNNENSDIENQFTSAQQIDPETLVINREDFKLIQRRIEEALSGLEFKVLVLYLSGRTYEEIARRLGVTVKSVDNSLQRIRRKLRKAVT